MPPIPTPTNFWDAAWKLAVMAIPVILAYFFGKRQENFTQRRTAELNAANASKTADAAQSTADAAQLSAALAGSNAAITALLSSATPFQTMAQQLADLSQKLATAQTNHIKDISDLKEAHSKESGELRQSLADLNSKFVALESASKAKDEQLADYARLREYTNNLERENLELRQTVEEHAQANNSFLYLFEAAQKGKNDPVMVNVAEQAIMRILKHTGQGSGGSSSPAPASSGVAATAAMLGAAAEAKAVTAAENAAENAATPPADPAPEPEPEPVMVAASEDANPGEAVSTNNR